MTDKKPISEVFEEYFNLFDEKVPKRYKNENGRDWLEDRIEKEKRIRKETKSKEPKEEEKNKKEKEEPKEEPKETKMTNRSGKRTKVLILKKNVKCNNTRYMAGSRFEVENNDLEQLLKVDAFHPDGEIVKKKSGIITDGGVLEKSIKLNNIRYTAGTIIEKSHEDYEQLKPYFLK